MLKFRDYIRVESRVDYEKALASVEGPVLLLAGGTDVLVKAREDDRYASHTLIDIFGIQELGKIEEAEDHLIIGAGATHQAIAQSPLVKRHAPLLAEASLSVGSLQLRNHSTIGGNIGNASPAADTFAALAILDARLVIWKKGQEVTLPLGDVVTGPYRTSLEDGDLIVSILVPKLAESVRTNFTKIGRRRALSISRMTIATLLEMDEEGVVTQFKMTLGATFPKPMDFPDISAMLVGKRPSDEDIRQVARALSDKIPEIAGIRASTRYKQPVSRRLSERILHELIGE